MLASANSPGELSTQPDFGSDPADFFLIFSAKLGICQLNSDLPQGAGELEWDLIVLADWRPRVLANIQRLIRRDAERDGPLDLPLRHLVAIHGQRSGTTFAQAAFVSEIEHDRMGAGSKPVGCSDRVTIDAYGVVVKHRLPLEQIEAPPIEASALCRKDTFRAAGRNFQVGADLER